MLKVKNFFKASFRRRPESSKFKYFWMPDQVRHDKCGTYSETNKVWRLRFIQDGGYINGKDGKDQVEVGIRTRRRSIRQDYGAASMGKEETMIKEV